MATTIYHPDLAGISREVDDAVVKRWTDQGWKKTAPEEPKEGTKEAVVAEAHKLGVDPEGTKDEVEARIAAYRAGSHGTIIG